MGNSTGRGHSRADIGAAEPNHRQSGVVAAELNYTHLVVETGAPNRRQSEVAAGESSHTQPEVAAAQRVRERPAPGDPGCSAVLDPDCAYRQTPRSRHTLHADWSKYRRWGCGIARQMRSHWR